jgi:NADH:ubiquinone oxidoreductase subunit 6 (subunit J)
MLLIKGRWFGLTYKVDKGYFGGRAGSMRMLTLVLSVVALGIGLPGYSPTPKLYLGYGASPLIPLAMTIYCLAILINVVFIMLLLFFREVRCQAKWDERVGLWICGVFCKILE